MEIVSLWLPFPPSLNSLYPGKIRRHKSKRYTQWIIDATHALSQQDTSMRFSEPVQITYRIGRPDKRQRDLANLEKAPSDLLVSHGILADDSLIHRLIMEWAEIEGVQVEIVRMVDSLR